MSLPRRHERCQSSVWESASSSDHRDLQPSLCRALELSSRSVCASCAPLAGSCRQPGPSGCRQSRSTIQRTLRIADSSGPKFQAAAKSFPESSNRSASIM